jgi:hypothetical protein
MSGRAIRVAAVRQARRTERIAISAPGDFVLEPWAPFRRDPDEAILPYCLDFLRRRSLYVGGVDREGAQTAPFYYLYLRRQARRVVSVPWEAGALDDAAAHAPIFLFSPGRCGSTLLSRILSAAGHANVSEPDFYTQATTAVAASRLNPLRATIARAAANMGADLAAALGAAPVVKLRAESCRAPDLLVQPAERRTLFMTRGFESWARSNGRAFRNGAQKSVGKYLRALACQAWLKRNSDCHVVCYEDLQADPAGTTGALGRFLGRAIAPDAVNAIMKDDSQAGTPVAQGARPDLPDWERRFGETMALWNSDKVKRARDRLAVDDIRAG